jgi:hypothetical protein
MRSPIEEILLAQQLPRPDDLEDLALPPGPCLMSLTFPLQTIKNPNAGVPS